MKSFDEFWDKFAIGLNADENEAQSIWEAGAQSRQAEIDCLKVQLDGANERAMMTLNHKNKMVEKKDREIDELKKRIDTALNKSKDFYDFGDGESAMAFCNEIINILKGNQS